MHRDADIALPIFRPERIADVLALPTLPVWLMLPEALRHVPRIARVLQALAAGKARVGRGEASSGGR